MGIPICPRTRTKVTRRDLYQESCIRLTVIAVTALLRFAVVLISVDSAVSPVEDHAARVVNQTTHPTTLGSSSGSGEAKRQSQVHLSSHATLVLASVHGLTLCGTTACVSAFLFWSARFRAADRMGRTSPHHSQPVPSKLPLVKSGLCAFFVSSSRVCFCITCRCFRVTKEEEKGEFRPLVLKTDRESVLRGEDYWIDYNEVIIVSKSSCGSFQRCAPRPKALVLLAAAVYVAVLR